jgi:hypothetical protein
MESGRRAGGAVVVLLAMALLLGLTAAARAAPWTALVQGRSGTYAFAVEGKRSAAAGLCLRVSVLDRHGPFSFDRSGFRSCAAPGAGLRARSAPLFAGGAQLGRAPGSGLSVFAALYAPAVRSAWLGLDDGGVSVELRRVDREEAEALELGRAGLGVVAVDGARCPTRALSRDSDGALLWDSGAGLGCGGFEAALAP